MVSLHTIKRSGDIQTLFSKGKRISGPYISALIMRTPEQRDQNGRVVFIAAKKMGSAPLRNRCKRVMRASVRRLGGPWEGYDVALIAQARVARVKPAVVDEEVTARLRKAKVL